MQRKLRKKFLIFGEKIYMKQNRMKEIWNKEIEAHSDEQDNKNNRNKIAVPLIISLTCEVTQHTVWICYGEQNIGGKA